MAPYSGVQRNWKEKSIKPGLQILVAISMESRHNPLSGFFPRLSTESERLMADNKHQEKLARNTSPPRKSSVRKWLSRIVSGAFVLLLLGALLLPWLASQMISGAATEEWISGQIPGSVQIGAASMGWQSPIMLNDISLSDDDGKELAQVKAVTSNQTFWDLFRRKTQPIELELEGLSVKVAVPDWKATGKPQQFDVNQLMDSLLKRPMPNFGREITVRVIKSRFDVTDRAGGLLNSWAPITGEYHGTAGTTSAHSVQLEAPVAQTSQNVSMNQQPVDSLSAAQTTVTANWSKNPMGGDRLDLEINCQNQPLTSLRELISPIAPDSDIPPVSGSITGSLQRVNQAAATLQVKTELDDLPRDGLDESPVDLDIQATYSNATDDLQVHQLYAQVDQVEVEVAGEVTELSARQNVDVQGTIRSPAETFVNLLPKELKESITFTDLQLSELSIKGPLRPDPQQPWNLKFEISTLASWQEANAYGLKSTNGKVRILLSGTDVSLEAVSLPINQGHIRTLPGFDLSTKPPTVVIENMLMLDNIDLTEELCRDWLQYVSPLLSQATATEGTLSLTPEAARFQLDKISESSMAGTLQIHKGRVRPGPLAQELIGPLTQAAALNGTRLANANNAVLMSVNDQSIPYVVQDGRVYHDDFNFNIGNLKLTTTGSVGFDRTIDLLVSMPFPENWTNRGPILQALQGESLDFHIVGTLDQPKLNARPLKETGQRIGIKAAEELLNRLIERRRQRRP